MRYPCVRDSHSLVAAAEPGPRVEPHLRVHKPCWGGVVGGSRVQWGTLRGCVLISLQSGYSCPSSTPATCHALEALSRGLFHPCEGCWHLVPWCDAGCAEPAGCADTAVCTVEAQRKHRLFRTVGGVPFALQGWGLHLNRDQGLASHLPISE